jgi:hypothetical protein
MWLATSVVFGGGAAAYIWDFVRAGAPRTEPGRAPTAV